MCRPPSTLHPSPSLCLQDAVAQDSAELAEKMEALRKEMEAGVKPSAEKVNEISEWGKGQREGRSKLGQREQ